MQPADASPMAGAGVAEEEFHRAGVYGLLARLLAAAPDTATLSEIAALENCGGAFGLAVSRLAEAAQTADPEAVGAEFHALFIGVGRGELMPYGSYYLTGFLHEKPLARLRADLRALGLARAPGDLEPEDNIAFLCEVMSGLITGAFNEPATLTVQQRFFDRHIGSWASRFFGDLEEAEAARFYRPVGAIGRLFLEIETEAFRIAV